MEEPCHNWFSDMEIEDHDDLIDFFNHGHEVDSLDDGDQILREIIHQPAFSSESEPHSPETQKNSSAAAGGNTTIFSSLSFNDLGVLNSRRGKRVIKSNSSNSIVTQHAPEKPATATAAISPTAYILSFDDSTVIPATYPETYGGKHPNQDQVGNGGASKEAAENCELEPRANQTTRKARRSYSETQDHIMAERKRRRQLTERFIALSATIPGLKKIDKASILSEAIIHVKQLQSRVRELEQQSKKINVESVSSIQKFHLGTDNGTASYAMNTDDIYRPNKALPVVEARVMNKDVLIRIHCKKQDGFVLKILAHLKSLHLSTISNSVLPFGNSTLDISIVAQMSDKFNVTKKDLVKNLRLALLASPEVKQ